jgi:hypothetical protein
LDDLFCPELSLVLLKKDEEIAEEQKDAGRSTKETN